LYRKEKGLFNALYLNRMNSGEHVKFLLKNLFLNNHRQDSKSNFYEQRIERPKFKGDKIKMKPNTGVTLLELMVALAIVAILASVSTPGIISWMSERKLGSASRDVLAAMQATRLRAVKDRSNAVVRFDTANETFIAFVDNGRGGGTADNNLRDGSETIIKTGDLTSQSLDITAADFDGNSFVVFSARGFSGQGSVTLENTAGNQRQVVVSSAGSSQITD
jgi:type IV fimbrial biogenesis protein FimT